MLTVVSRIGETVGSNPSLSSHTTPNRRENIPVAFSNTEARSISYVSIGSTTRHRAPFRLIDRRQRKSKPSRLRDQVASQSQQFRGLRIAVPRVVTTTDIARQSTRVRPFHVHCRRQHCGILLRFSLSL